ncbi:hypothetical protein [Streptomyces sp. NPDC046942]|uniref:hypothetical protein n=1 Tax=Streptomyces sp. NPDC046942 TaxID=3155137 RepID=UPI003405EF7F
MPQPSATLAGWGEPWRRAARALWWTVLCALGAAVPAGVSLLSLRFMLDLWRGGHPIVAALFAIGLQVLMLIAGAVLFSHTSRHRVAGWAGVVLLSVGYWGTGSLGGHDADQQAIHDRGVTGVGVVTKTRDDDMAQVRLGDGTTINVSGDGPGVGSTVEVIYDPLHRVDALFGPRPAAPGGRVPKVFLAVMIAGSVVIASSVAGRFGEALDPRRLRRRHALVVDDAPVDKAPPEVEA